MPACLYAEMALHAESELLIFGREGFALMWPVSTPTERGLGGIQHDNSAHSPKRSQPLAETPSAFYRRPEQSKHGTARCIEDGLDAREPVTRAVPAGNLELLRSALSAAADRIQVRT